MDPKTQGHTDAVAGTWKRARELYPDNAADRRAYWKGYGEGQRECEGGNVPEADARRIAATRRQRAKMAEGRRRSEYAKGNLSVERVADYTRWLKSGSRMVDLGRLRLGIPTDHDYAIARERGAVA